MQRDGGPGGAGGAGNPVGGSFTGPAEALEIVGDHCYAYSGSVEIQTSETDFLNFTTGNYYSVVKIQVDSTAGSGNNMDFIAKMNGAIIVENEIAADFQVYPAFSNALELIIPPYTEVQIAGAVATAAKRWTLVLTGRIYRG